MKTTQKKFFEVLKKRAKKHGFELRRFGGWYLREKCTGFCPVNAVVNELTGDTPSNFEVIDAADLVGLPRDFATEVIRASDNHWFYRCGKGQPLYQMLLEAVGVQSNSAL